MGFVRAGILAIGILLSFNGFAQKVTSSDQYSRHMNHIIGEGFEGVVFSSSFPFPFIDSIDSPQRFTPTLAEIEQAESIFTANISELNKLHLNQGGTKGPVIEDNMSKYIRQYFGYLTDDNERIIYISCLWNTNQPKPERWRQGAVLVVNGGSNYFQVQANLTTRDLFALTINKLDRPNPDGSK